VGSGARVYDIVGRIAPNKLVAFMMGYRKRVDEEAGGGLGLKRGLLNDHKTDLVRERDRDLSTGSGSGNGTPAHAAGPPWGFSSVGSESGIWEKI